MASDTPSSWGSLLAGATAATVVDAIIFPLDTLKTRAQASGGLARNGGYTNLYKGLASVACCTVPSAAVFFWGYETFKRRLGGSGAGTHLAASAGAEVLSCAVLAPAEIIKQRAQVSGGQAAQGDGGATKTTTKTTTSTPSTRAIVREFIRARDVRGLGRGYLGLLGRNVPVTAIQFVLYENFKTRYRKYKHEHGGGVNGAGNGDDDDERDESGSGKYDEIKLGAIESGFCAGASGSIAAGVTTPMDVIKTRVMLGQSNSATTNGKEGSGGSGSNAGMVQTGLKVFREEGVRALFKGVAIRIVWTSLGLSLYLGSYEAMKNYIDG